MKRNDEPHLGAGTRTPGEEDAVREMHVAVMVLTDYDASCYRWWVERINVFDHRWLRWIGSN